ncbi:hypothetical protein [Leifsonia sp. Root112D2]|uniref:hypothetical protein n=1 Tax=Leifsonia sp. Root112D2 TaxID=1736426 RepID=UPI0012FC541B|nr:hypothetical protein [Leifsonia sp. Root112D2]
MADTERGRRHRRVQRPGAAGADPTPKRVPRAVTPARASDNTGAAQAPRGDSNDARLREDVPPHWG